MSIYLQLIVTFSETDNNIFIINSELLYSL